MTGEAQPTLKQLEDFARLTHTAIGYFFLPEPPALALPVPDFRTLRDEELREPSSALLDTLYLCQQRQDWYRDYAHGPVPAASRLGCQNARIAHILRPNKTRQGYARERILKPAGYFFVRSKSAAQRDGAEGAR